MGGQGWGGILWMYVQQQGNPYPDKTAARSDNPADVGNGSRDTE